MGAITPSVIEIFEKNKHILTKLKNVENVKKSKNREHFIISVFKVGQGKKNSQSQMALSRPFAPMFWGQRRFLLFGIEVKSTF